jgi:tRNA-Thr(GGU) m(6)t(6)A37 methyltransferase TsaA
MPWWERFFDWVARVFATRRRVVPRDPTVMRPIGIVRNAIAEPRPHGWEHVRSDIILREELSPMLEGIDGYSHVIVIFAFHRVPDSARRDSVRPRGDERVPEQGVLATRSQLRPNPVGVAVVPLMKRRKNILRVEGLDAIDGTPVLDIKPYFPGHDAVATAQVPDWAREIDSTRRHGGAQN